MKIKKTLFIFFSLCCLLGATIHFQGFLGYREGNQGRHLFFLFLNIWGIYLMQKRPTFLVYLMPFLIIQQYYSHGTHAYHLYLEKKDCSSLDIAVFILLPVAYYFILKDFYDKKT